MSHSVLLHLQQAPHCHGWAWVSDQPLPFASLGLFFHWHMQEKFFWQLWVYLYYMLLLFSVGKTRHTVPYCTNSTHCTYCTMYCTTSQKEGRKCELIVTRTTFTVGCNRVASRGVDGGGVDDWWWHHFLILRHQIRKQTEPSWRQQKIALSARFSSSPWIPWTSPSRGLLTWSYLSCLGITIR